MKAALACLLVLTFALNASAASITLKNGGSLKGVTLGGGTFAPDWSDCSSVVAYWPLDEASGTREATKGSCGSDCDLDSVTGTPTQVTGIRDNAISTGTGTSTYVSCADATCDELDFSDDGTTDLSVVGWLTPGNAFGNTFAIYNGSVGESGWAIKGTAFGATTGIVAFRSSSTDYSQAQAAGPDTEDMWTFFFGNHDDSANTTGVCAANTDAGWVCGPDDTTASLTAGTADFLVGWNQATSTWTTRADEIAVLDVLLTDAEACRICSCWLDGTNCRISGTTWLDTGLNATSCGSCTLPTATAGCPT